MVSMAVLTTSYGPTETPPDDDQGVGAVGEAAARSRVRTSSRSSVAMPRSIGLAAGRGHERAKARAVGVGDAGRPERLARRADLVAGREDARCAAGDGRGVARRRRRPAASRPPRSIAVPAWRRVAPASRSLPRARTEPPGGTGSWTRQAPGTGPVASRPRGPARPAASSGVVVLDRDDGIGAIGKARAGRDAGGRSGLDRHVRRGAGRDVTDDPQFDGLGLGRRGDIGRPDRVAVHRRIRPRRERDARRRRPRR